jgi:hypothetical protein
MANYVYTGMPTFGKTTKDIKIPKGDGTFYLFNNVQPNVTQIVVTDKKAEEFCDKSQSFKKVS